MGWSTFTCRISSCGIRNAAFDTCLARDYPDAARGVIKAMHEQVGELRVDENGLALRGVIVRHLLMPGLLEDTGQIVRWLAGEISPDTYVNVMDQYYPAWKAKTEAKFSGINRE